MSYLPEITFILGGLTVPLKSKVLFKHIEMETIKAAET
jgi:hypothetical protein